MAEPQRCWWASSDPLLAADHDEAWGRPVTDDTQLFEMLTLEAFQAGLSWLTILRKRDSFRAAFRGFDPRVVANFDDADRERLRHAESRSHDVGQQRRLLLLRRCER